MTSTQPSNAIQDHPLNKINTDASFQAHLIEVSLNDLDSDIILIKDICAILPAYNDEVRIGSVVLRTKQFAGHVIVVDDGSSDRTAEVAKLAGAEVIQLEYTLGKTYAILLGLRRAREIRYPVTVLLDADGQHDPREIHRFAGLILAGKADLVIGSRFLEKSGDIPLKQRIKQKMLQLPAGTPPNLIPTDPLSGFIAFSSKALVHLDFPFEKTRFHQNLIKHFLSKGLLIQEVGIIGRSGNPMKFRWDNTATIIAALPAYNEETYLAKIIPMIKSYVDLVIVVDDGSTDAK